MKFGFEVEKLRKSWALYAVDEDGTRGELIEAGAKGTIMAAATGYMREKLQ